MQGGDKFETLKFQSPTQNFVVVFKTLFLANGLTALVH